MVDNKVSTIEFQLSLGIISNVEPLSPPANGARAAA